MPALNNRLGATRDGRLQPQDDGEATVEQTPDDPAPAPAEPQDLADVRQPKTPVSWDDTVVDEPPPSAPPAGEGLQPRPEASLDTPYDRPPAAGRPTPTLPAAPPADATALPEDRLVFRVPRKLQRAVYDHVTRQQRAGHGGRRDLMVGLVGRHLPTRYDDADGIAHVVELAAHARAWRRRAGTTSQMTVYLPTVVKEHIQDVASWATRAHGVDHSMTDIVVALLLTEVDPDAPPPGAGKSTDRLEQVLSQFGHA